MRIALFLPLLALGLVATGCDAAYDTGSTDGLSTSYVRVAGGAGAPLFADLSGANEVTNDGRTGVGDPDGTGFARVSVNPGQGQVCWEITVENIATPRAGHIHEAPAGRNGPVVVDFHSNILSGCTSVSRDLAREILQAPADYYVNIHNAEFPAGAVRGQLRR